MPVLAGNLGQAATPRRTAMGWSDWGGSQGSWQAWQPERQAQEEPPGTPAPMQATAIPVRGNVATDAWLPQAEGNREQATLARDWLQATRPWRCRDAEDYLSLCELRLTEANNRLEEAWQRRKTAKEMVIQAEWGVLEAQTLKRLAATSRPRRKRRRTAEAVEAEQAPSESSAAEAVE